MPCKSVFWILLLMLLCYVECTSKCVTVSLSYEYAKCEETEICHCCVNAEQVQNIMMCTVSVANYLWNSKCFEYL